MGASFLCDRFVYNVLFGYNKLEINQCFINRFLMPQLPYFLSKNTPVIAL